ncbi:MAG TPA: mobile mystery protein A [Ignavibacteriaceae bacterium]|nr:mobile mystery protein A [Ignavibacteriaceae bacterium]
MSKEKQKLMIEQLDRRFSKIISLSKEFEIPIDGWINILRKTLNISLKQLGKRLNVSSQNINQYEQREKDGSISIQKLREVANALDMDFVYTFIPKEGSLEKLIEKRANIVAKDIVMRTSHTMKLEDQENTEERLKKAIKDRAEKIKNELPRYLWD